MFKKVLTIVCILVLFVTNSAQAALIGDVIGDGAWQNWLVYPSSATHWDKVDEVTCNTSDLVYTPTFDRESFVVATPTTTYHDIHITSVGITPCAARYNRYSGSPVMKVFFRAHNTDSSDYGSYTLTSPNVSVLSKTTIPASLILQPGETLEVGVVYVSGDGGVKVSNIKTDIIWHYHE